MAIDFICGFECRIPGTPGAANVPDERHWDAEVGTSLINTTTFRSGTASLEVSPAAANEYVRKILPSGRRVLAGRFYIWFDALPGGVTILVNCENTGGDPQIRINSSGQLDVIVVGGTAVTFGSTLSLDTWYLIDFLVDSSTGTTSIKARLDGGSESEATFVQAAADTAAIRFGSSSTTTFDAKFDDIILGTVAGDYPFGAGSVERMKPTSDGTHSFTAADFGYDAAGGDVSTSATNVYSYVDDDDLLVLTEFIRQKVVRTTGYVEVKFDTAPFTHDALAVGVVYSNHASGATQNFAGWKLTSNGGTNVKNLNDESGDALSDFSSTTVAHGEKVLTAPTEGGTWTQSKLQAIRVRLGYASNVGSLPYFDGVMLEVAYPPAGAAETEAPAQAATGVGAALAAAVLVGASALTAIGVGAAHNATVRVAPHAAAATGVGAALNPAPRVSPRPAAATGTGAALTPGTGRTTVTATGVGAAQNPTVRVAPNAAAATGVGAAANPGPKVGVNVLTATGIGAAHNPTVSTATSASASAIAATGTGQATNPTVAVKPTGLAATGTGAAQNPTTRVQTTALVATGSGASGDVDARVGVNVQVATGTGAAQGPAPRVGATAVTATGTGAALNATVSTSSSASAAAQVATGIGAATNPAPRVGVNALLASGTGAGHNATVATSAGTSASAGVATGTGAASQAAVRVAPTAGQASRPDAPVFVSRAAAGTNTVALPTFAVGDIAIVSAFRSGSTTPPTTPLGWESIASSGADTCSQAVGCRVLESGDTSSGVWTNASNVQVIVIRGQHPTTPVGASAQAGASSNQISYPALTLVDTSGSSWVLGVAGHRTATNVGGTAVTGMTTRSGASTTIGAHTAEAVSSWSLHNYDAVVNATSGWRSYSIEIRGASHGVAHDPAPAVAVSPSPATGVGAALAPTPSVSVRPSPATGVGVANNATVSTVTATNAAAVVATGTGAAQQPLVRLKTNAALATGLGQAYDATVATGSNVNAASTVATGSGTALNATVAISVRPAAATGVGAAGVPSATIRTTAVAATGSGQAPGASAAVMPRASAATGVGQASGVDPAVAVGALRATGLGVAHNPTAAIIQSGDVFAIPATGIGRAYDAVISVPRNREPTSIRLEGATGSRSSGATDVRSAGPSTPRDRGSTGDR